MVAIWFIIRYNQYKIIVKGFLQNGYYQQNNSIVYVNYYNVQLDVFQSAEGACSDRGGIFLRGYPTDNQIF